MDCSLLWPLPNTRRLSVRNGSNPPAPWLFVPWARIWSCPASWVTQFLWGACSWVMRLAFVLYPSCVQKTNGIKSFWQKNGAPRMAFASDWSARTAAFASDFALLDFFLKFMFPCGLPSFTLSRPCGWTIAGQSLWQTWSQCSASKTSGPFKLGEVCTKMLWNSISRSMVASHLANLLVTWWCLMKPISAASEGFPNLLRVKGQPKLKIGSSNETEDCKAPASPHRA